MDENNTQEFEQVLDKTEAEKELQKSKIKLIIKGVCLVLAIIGSICITVMMKMDRNNSNVNEFLQAIVVIGFLAGYAGTIVSNALIGILKQYGKFFIRLGQIIPFFGWIIAIGLIPVFLYFPAILCIKPLKDEFTKYKQLKLLAE